MVVIVLLSSLWREKYTGILAILHMLADSISMSMCNGGSAMDRGVGLFAGVGLVGNCQSIVSKSCLMMLCLSRIVAFFGKCFLCHVQGKKEGGRHCNPVI